MMVNISGTGDILKYSFHGPEEDELLYLYSYLYGQVAGSPEKHEEAQRILDVAHDISNIYIWILFAIGVPANILAIATVLTMPKVTPATFLVTLLAALDCTALVAKLTGHQIVRHELYRGTVGCKLQFLLIYIVTMANWVLIFICFDRFLSVCFPAKKSTILTGKRVYIGVAVVGLGLLIVFASITGVMRGAAGDGYRCGVYNEYLWFWTHAWYWINATLLLFIPFLFIFPMTVWMVGTRYATVKRRNPASLKKEPENEREQASPTDQPIAVVEERPEEENCFTIMIVLTAGVFLILSLPACIYYLSYSTNTDPVAKAGWALFEQLQHLLIDSTHVVNFFLYFISAKMFRDQLIRLLFCEKCRETTFTPATQEATNNA